MTLMVVGEGVGGQVGQQFAKNDNQNVNAAFLMATFGSIRGKSDINLVVSPTG